MPLRHSSILVILLAGCSSSPSPDEDLQYIKQARSIAAEWALVNELDAQHRLTRTYVDSMHRWLSDGLETSFQGLSEPESDYGAEMKILLAAPPGEPAANLRAHADKLKAIEDNIESA